MLELEPKAASAFEGLVPAHDAFDGLEITDCDGAGLATLIVRRGARSALCAALASHYGLDLQDGPRLSRADRFILLGTGADSWLAVSSGGQRDLSAHLAQRLGGFAALCDQSDGYGLLQLGGPNARLALQRLLPLDLHPDAFTVGAVANTLADHIPILLWRSGETDWGVAVFRSYAASFIHALDGASRPFRRAARG